MLPSLNITMIYKDVRLNQTTPSDEFIINNKQTLRIYDWLMKSDILSNDVPSTLSQVATGIKYSGLFNDEDTQKFLDFLRQHDTTGIQFSEPYY